MKSREFCKRRIEELGVDIDMSVSAEINTKDFLNGTCDIQMPLRTNLEKDNINVTVLYDPDADFDYYTYSSSVNDGTGSFHLKNITKCIRNIIFAQTYDKRKEPPIKNCNVKYTIGNIVVVDEYGEKFATDEKPWRKTRMTAMIPIKYDIE